MRVLVVDNHDSFTGNLVHDLARVTGVLPEVVRADAAPPAPVADRLRGYDAIVVSPGPGTPENPADLGLSAAVVRQGEVPVLGVCLGMQAIAHAAGARVVRAPRPVHGEVAQVVHDGTGLFTGLPNPLEMVRYHSLVVTDLPESLVVDATCDDLVMALHHRDLPLWRVQTHPESICSIGGRDLLRSFLDLAARWNAEHGRGSLVGGLLGGSRPVGDAGAASDSGPTSRWVIAARVAYAGSGEAVFDALFRGEDHAWWLDSAAPGSPAAPASPADPDGRGVAVGGPSVSACGATGGPLARVATVDADGVLRVEDACGAVSLPEGDVLDLVSGDVGTVDPVVEHIDVDLSTVQGPGAPGTSGSACAVGRDPELSLAELPFGPGWIGYLGYEEACAVLLPGESAAESAPEDGPRATFVLTDRLVALDHAGTAWVLALADDTCAQP